MVLGFDPLCMVDFIDCLGCWWGEGFLFFFPWSLLVYFMCTLCHLSWHFNLMHFYLSKNKIKISFYNIWRFTSICRVMEKMQYAEELVREFLVFRGFTNTLQAFEGELCTDIGKGFQVDKILDLIFSVYIPKFQAEKLVCLLSFFKQCFSSSSETVLIATLSKLEVSILRYYIVHAIQSGRTERVIEFFGMNGNDLLQRGQDWTPWFGGCLPPRSVYFVFLNTSSIHIFKFSMQLFHI